MKGTVHPSFAQVATVFGRQLSKTSGGAAIAVYHRGELVVDLWGGERGPGLPWDADTLAMSFSTTKGVASTAVHMLAERGLLKYDDRVSEYWPEFAQNGKGDLRIEHLLTHSAGLHRIRTLIDGAQRMLDWEWMVNALAETEPAYEPGTQNGYHALTYGWLVGEVIRRVDGRDIQTFVADEIAKPLELEGLFIGCPPEQRHRATLPGKVGLDLVSSNPRARQLQKKAGFQIGRALTAMRSPFDPRRAVNALVPRGMGDFFWTEQVMDAAIPAANGFFDARSLAKMYALIAEGGALGDTSFFEPTRVEQMGEIRSRRRDLVLGFPMRWRRGYHLVGSSRGIIHSGFGHFGFGGSGAWCDPQRRLAVAMVCNRGSGTPVGDSRLLALNNAVMKSLPS